ncbi:uncharacterized protein DEA37_0009499, partial [Paragonimus westermani]
EPTWLLSHFTVESYWVFFVQVQIDNLLPERLRYKLTHSIHHGNCLCINIAFSKINQCLFRYVNGGISSKVAFQCWELYCCISPSAIFILLVGLFHSQVNILANMVPYIMGYVKSKVDKGIKDSRAIWFSALALGVQGVSMPLGGFVSKKIGYRVVVVTGCLLESLGVIISCFTIQSSFVGVLITYSLMKGAGISFGYSVVIAVAGAWFPARRGLVVGLVVGGFGLGPLIFAPIQKAFVNPENVKVNEETKQFTDDKLLDRVPYIFLLLGSLLLSIQFIGFALLREKTETAVCSSYSVVPNLERTNDNATEKKIGEPATGPSPSSASSSVPFQPAPPPTSVSVPSSAPQVVSDEENIPPKEVLRCPNFYLLWIVMFCNIIPTTTLTSAYKYFGQKLIQDDQFLTAVAATSSVFNAGGRVVWGLIIDKLSFKMPLCILLILWASFLVTFPHIGLTEGILLQGLYFFWVCAMFFLLSGIFTIMPAATSTLFGPVNLAVNYGMLFTAFALGSLACAGVSSAAAGDDPYLYQFTGCGCACIVGLLVTIWIEDKKMHPKLNVFKCFTGQCAKRSAELSQC